MDKRVTAKQAIGLIKDGDTVAISGFQLATAATGLYAALAKSFRETGHPRDLTLMQAAGNMGVVTMSEEGLWRRYITGHFASNQKMIDMANNNKIEAYNFPQGVICHMYRAAAAGKAGEVSRIGLGTFCDPRQGGGKLNDRTKEDLVKLVDIDGEEYLLYKTPRLDIALVRGTTSDEYGNITIEEESSSIDMLDVVMGVKGRGGKVIVQVKNYVSSASIDRSRVLVPGCMVDAIYVAEKPESEHLQTPGAFYDPAIAGHYRLGNLFFATLPMNERKVIARRAAMELSENSVVNLGIGIPECVANVASEEGVGDKLILTLESGLIGGIPAGGVHFGSSYNAWAGIPMASIFDYYNGGNLSFTSLGFAEVDASGNINVSKFGEKIAGAGGFIDISSSTPVIAFTGTMTTGGFKCEIKDGKMVILKEGRRKKFLKSIEQITFNAKENLDSGKKILFITERCVFQLTKDGLLLTEVAPGISVDKDILPMMEFQPQISANLKLMDKRIFREEPMGLAQMINPIREC